MTRIAIDTGGTFTDVVTDDGRVLKLPSSRRDPVGVMTRAVSALTSARADIVHGTTVATNAVLEGQLARVGVLVNRGFKDLLLIGRQARPDLYALEPRRPNLPTTRELHAEIPGRLGPGGEELEPLDVLACTRAGRRLVRAGAEAFAVVFLHAYARRDHEQRARAALEPLGLPITLSTDLSPEFREVERGVAAVINAGLTPLVGDYLGRLTDSLGKRVHVMMSEGGVTTPLRAAAEPARLLVSGPAGGLVAARTVAEDADESVVLTLDMGGTSTDVALLLGELPRTSDLAIAGHRIRLPSLDIHTVGAGGGSIVRRDRGGALTVGPESAGADPGPAAYGVGDELTVTDANLLLGRLDPDFFASGPESLDIARAERVARRVARHVGISLASLLEGAITVVNVVMARALRAISLERGVDPRGAALLVFGGAGGLHAAALARALGMRRVLVPRQAGVLSALGLLWAPRTETRSQGVVLDHVPSRTVRRRLMAPLERELLRGFAADGHPRRSVRVSFGLDLRYAGQSFELEVPESRDVVADFHAAHLRRFGFMDIERAVELVAVRVRALAATPLRESTELPRRRKGRVLPIRTWPSPVTSGVALSVYDREDLCAGDLLSGPALCVDRTGTTLLDENTRARVHASGTLVLEVD